MVNTNENKIEYLQMIQSCIDRMSMLSNVFKGFAATLVVGISVIMQSNELSLKIILAMPLLCFIIMDVYYLQLERRFRALFNAVRCGKHKIDFDLQPPLVKDIKSNYKNVKIINCLTSISIWLYYVPLIIIIIISILK